MKFGLKKQLLGALVLLVVLIWESRIERDLHFPLDGFGFYAWFGFVACLVMVLVALLIGFVLKRRDDYYND